MVRTMISSSSAFGSARARRARSQNQYYCTFGLVFDLSSGDSGLARARCGPFTGSCGRTRALRATWRESVARVTLRWSAERKELPEKPSRGGLTSRALRARATRRGREPRVERGGLTHEEVLRTVTRRHLAFAARVAVACSGRG